MALIGIDLGTTNSLAAVYKDGTVTLIPNRFGSFLTPSVVSLKQDGEIVVGELARELQVTDPSSTASGFKRDMGTSRTYRLGKQEFTPEELSSFVLRSLIGDAEAYLGEPVEEAVISVPAYFHDKQRLATKRAGALAGIRVDRLYNEPSAAAMASYVDKETEKLFMIFDFGGGTLDISIVQCYDTVVQIKAVAGDNQLGGRDFDALIADAFLKEHGLEKDRLSAAEYALILRAAERCKIALTSDKTAVMSTVIRGEKKQSTFDNNRLMQECSSLLFRIKKIIDQALKDGRFHRSSIDHVVIAGGSGRMPLVRAFLRHIMGKIPLSGDSPDEMVAKGLGVVCGIMENNEDLEDYTLTDICPFSLGVNVVNRANPSNPYTQVVIPRNSALPCSRVETFTTVSDNQTLLLMKILQGEHMYARENLQLGELQVRVPPAPAGKEAVKVRYTYDINGILDVEAAVISTGEHYRQIISDGISKEELEKRLRELETYKVNPTLRPENELVIERMKSMYEESDPFTQQQIMAVLQEFEKILMEGDLTKTRKYRKYLEKVLEDLGSFDPSAEIIPFPSFSEDDYEDEDEMPDNLDFDPDDGYDL